MKVKLLLLSLMTLVVSCVESSNARVKEKNKDLNLISSSMKLNYNSEVETREYSVEKRTEFSNPQIPGGFDATSITEDVSITFDKTNSMEMLAKVDISDVKQDGKRLPDNSINQYFLKSGEVLNKLYLTLSADGRIEKVANREEVLQNWGYIKVYLDNYFVSDDANVTASLKGWTQQIENTVKNEALFLQTIENDLFYNRFFYGYWMDYSLNGQLVKNQSFPGLFGQANVVLTDKLTSSDKGGKIEVEISGKLNREASDMESIAESLDIENDDLERLTVELKGKCLFDAVGLIEELDIKAEAKMDDSDFRRTCSLVVKRR